MDIEIKQDETIEDLQYKGLRLIQKNYGFRFGVDAVLISDFAEIRAGDEVLDIGTGSGVIPILLSGKTKAKFITGVEIQHDIAEMASRSVLLNQLSEKVKIIEGDIKNREAIFPKSKFDVVVTNPPYIKQNGGIISDCDLQAIARHEVKCTLADVLEAGSLLLKDNGRMAMVHRPERLVDIITLMRENMIEPKVLRFVYPSKGKKAIIVLIRGTKHGNPQLNVLEPLYIHKENGEYSEEINRIYCREGR